MGKGFSYVGRQVHLEKGGEDYYIDVLLYHLKLILRGVGAENWRFQAGVRRQNEFLLIRN